MTQLNRQIEQLIYECAPDFKIAQVIKRYIKEYFKTLPDIFSQTGGKDFLVKHTNKIDTVVKLVYKIAIRDVFGNYTPPKNYVPIALAALGSYGREQLCVHSDIDLMLVYENTDGYKSQEIIEKMLYMFWDIGLKLGHRVHELSELPEVARGDITIKSAILESRFIEGSAFLWTGVENKLTIIRKEKQKEYIIAKIEEQRLLHQRFPITMEPNLKEGVGGFRDANLVFWVGKILYNVPKIRDLPNEIVQESNYRQFRIALEFLFRVRSALHLVSKKKEDRLRLERLPDVARLLGYDSTPHAHMRFAKKTIDSLRMIKLFGKIWLEKMVSSYIPELYDDKLDIDTKDKRLIELLEELNKNAINEYRVHPRVSKALLDAKKPARLNEALKRTIKDIFNQEKSQSTLKALHEARLLNYILPTMKKVIDLPQFDGYHQYAVDVHSLHCLWHLENIEDDYIKQIYNNLKPKEKALLKMVVFMHDAGKGRKRDHHLVGVSLFRLFAKSMKLEGDLATLGERLIQYHNLMSTTAQREDLYSEKTILQFASRFNSKLLLDMIYLLTYADMRGVGEGIYNNFNARLIKTLYVESIEVLKHNEMLGLTARKLKKIETLKKNNEFLSLSNSVKKKILSISSNDFFIHNSREQILDISIRAIEVQRYSYQIANKSFLTIEIIKKENIHLATLLSKLANLHVVRMSIFKLFDGLKYFKIDFMECIDESEMPLVEYAIEDAFSKKPKKRLKKPEIFAKEIEIDCEHSRDYAMMRLRSKDQRGMLAYIINLLDSLSIDIASAKIHTIKSRVNDLFLIEKDGSFCHNTDNIINDLTELTCVE